MEELQELRKLIIRLSNLQLVSYMSNEYIETDWNIYLDMITSLENQSRTISSEADSDLLLHLKYWDNLANDPEKERRYADEINWKFLINLYESERSTTSKSSPVNSDEFAELKRTINNLLNSFIEEHTSQTSGDGNGVQNENK